jgi:hypothetical protein
MSAGPSRDDKDDIDQDDDEAPETPTDEPTPVPIDDPPAEPDPPPMVVGGGDGEARKTRGQHVTECWNRRAEGTARLRVDVT